MIWGCKASGQGKLTARLPKSSETSEVSGRNGNHPEIAQWQAEQSLLRTRERRGDLLPDQSESLKRTGERPASAGWFLERSVPLARAVTLDHGFDG